MHRNLSGKALMRPHVSFAAALLLCTALHAAQATLGPVTFDSPAGWAVASRGDAVRVLTPPDLPAGREAVVLVLLMDAADLDAGFGAVIDTLKQGKTVLESSEMLSTKTKQGHPALSRSLTLQEEGGGGRMLGDFIGVQLDGRIVAFCLVASDAALQEKFRPAFMALVGHANFGQPAPAAGAPAAAPRKNVDPPPVDRDAYAKQVEARRKAGFVLGTITDAAGKPLKDARCSVGVRGTTMAGERSHFTAQVGEDGTYEVRVPDGVYALWLTCRVRFDGRTIPLQLEPLDGKAADVSYASRGGIVKDYRLRLTGLRPGQDADKVDGYYGVVVAARDDSVDGNNKLASHYPAGSKFQLTLTPKTTAVDGSTLDPVVLETPLARVSEGAGVEWGNIPIARYAATARVVTPDGKTRPLNLSGRRNQGFAASAEVTFWPTHEGSDFLGPTAVYVWD